MSEQYRIQVFMTYVDRDQARLVREALSRIVKGSGKEQQRDIMRRAHGGERVLVYQSNLDADAEDVALRLKNAGAKVEIEGLSEPEEIF